VRMPHRIGSLINDLLALRGYAQSDTSLERQQAWQAIVGPNLASYSLAGDVRRGVLNVVVANSTVLQEITLRKTQILAGLCERLRDQNIRDLRLRVGALPNG